MEMEYVQQVQYNIMTLTSGTTRPSCRHEQVNGNKPTPSISIADITTIAVYR